MQSITGVTDRLGADLFIQGSQGTGTGAGGSIIFQVAPAGSTGTAQNALSTALTINSAQQALFSAGTASAPSLAFAARTTQGFYDGGGYIVVALGGQKSATFGTIQGATTGAVTVPSGGGFAFSSTNDADGALDTYLRRDAANTLALRNANNGQIFRLYGRFTDITNDFERFFINAPTTSGDAVQLGTQKGATAGTARALELQTDGTTRLTIAAAGAATFTGTITGAQFISSGDYKAGASGFFYFNGRSNIDSPANGNIRLTNAAVNDFDRLQFGGTTSSFPALKRSTTTLQARLADDTAFASVQGKLTTDTAYTAGDPATTGYLVVYDSTGTAYKIPALAV
jgi:hypothetical protein